jgi:uncharacterized membrane protein YphA (DoxX/SURF4 family)
MTTTQRMPRLWPVIPLTCRLALGVVWVVAGAAKVTALDDSVRAVRAYQLLPDLAAQIVGAGLPVVEILLGLLLLLGAGVRVSAVLSAPADDRVRDRHRLGVGARPADRLRLFRIGWRARPG